MDRQGYREPDTTRQVWPAAIRSSGSLMRRKLRHRLIGRFAYRGPASLCLPWRTPTGEAWTSLPRMGPTRDVNDRAVSLRVFPTDDVSFRADAEASLLSGAESPAALQREPTSCRSGPRPRGDRHPGWADIWYVFRYAAHDRRTAGGTSASIPRAILDDRRRFVDVSPSLAEIVEAPVEQVVGRTVEEFSNPDDTTALADVEALLVAVPERRPAGRHAPLPADGRRRARDRVPPRRERRGRGGTPRRSVRCPSPRPRRTRGEEAAAAPGD